MHLALGEFGVLQMWQPPPPGCFPLCCVCVCMCYNIYTHMYMYICVCALNLARILLMSFSTLNCNIS